MAQVTILRIYHFAPVIADQEATKVDEIIHALQFKQQSPLRFASLVIV